jgi:transcriptional regulator GlxA family with amidase domain
MPEARVNATTADAIRDRYGAFFAHAFVPQLRYEQMPGAEERTAYAAEFVAYRLGQIDEKLGRLIDVMERATAQPVSAGK